MKIMKAKQKSNLRIKIENFFGKIKGLSDSPEILRKDLRSTSGIPYFTYSLGKNAEVFTVDFSDSTMDVTVWCSDENFVGHKSKCSPDSRIYPVTIKK